MLKHGACINYETSPEYGVWKAMIDRCNNPNNKRFHDYGGRGIKVSPEWSEFGLFFKDMGNRPNGTTLDRIDNNGDYEPGNCRWATTDQQYYNKRNTRFVKFKGQMLTLKEASAIIGLKPHTIRCRLNRGWSEIEAVLSLPRSIRHDS